MGFATVWNKPETWRIFEYNFKIQQWIVLVAAYLHAIMLKMLSDKEQILKCNLKAQNRLKEYFPKTNTVFQKIYNLKRNIILGLIFTIFYILIIACPRSLIFWGF